MDGFKGIVKAQIWLLKNHIARLRNEPPLKVIFILCFVLLFWFGALGISYRGFRFLNRFPLVGGILVDETIYLFFAALFIMLTLSSIVICYVTFYTSSEVDFLFSKPIQDTLIFFYRFMQSVVFSSWAFLFLGVPFIIAYALIKQVPFWFYISIPFYFVPYLIMPTALASLIILAFMRFLDFQKVKYILGLAICFVLGLFYWAYKINVRPAFSARTEMEFIMNDLLHHLRYFRYPLFPGYWISRSIISSSINQFSDALFYFLAFIATTLFLLQINWFVAKKAFFLGWVSSKGGRKERVYPVNKGMINRMAYILFFLPRSTITMIIKDTKLFLRDPGQWSQFLIYFSILGIYIFNLRNIPTEAISPFWRVNITFLNLMATILVLASLTVRFLFPLMSLEGNKIWVLGLAPITFRRLILQKFVTYLIGILAISESLMFATNVILKTSRPLIYVSCGVAGLASFGLVGLSIGLGSIYPDFKEDNTAKIVSGFGGTLNFVIALFYVVIMTGAFLGPFYSYEVNAAISAKAFHSLITISWVITIGTTAMVCILPMVLGYRQLEHMEY
ncbi:MAG: putative ABC transporter permease subunit [bacterium]